MVTVGGSSVVTTVEVTSGVVVPSVAGRQVMVGQLMVGQVEVGQVGGDDGVSGSVKIKNIIFFNC